MELSKLVWEYFESFTYFLKIMELSKLVWENFLVKLSKNFLVF